MNVDVVKVQVTVFPNFYVRVLSQSIKASVHSLLKLINPTPNSDKNHRYSKNLTRQNV